MSLREPVAPDGRPKLLLSVQTRSVETARSIWPEADEQDVGDLRMYFDWRNEEEVAVARAAFERAQALGVAFFRLDDLVGEQITDFDQALAVARDEEAAGEVEAAAPAPASPAEETAPEPARGRGGRRGSRIQGIPPVRGGSVAAAAKSSPRLTPTIKAIVAEARRDGLGVAEMLEQVLAHARGHGNALVFGDAIELVRLLEGRS